MSVCPSVRHVRGFCQLKRINMSSTLFHHRVAIPLLSFSVPHGMAIILRRPPNGGVKCRWDRHKSRLSIVVVDRYDCWTCEQQVRQSTVQFIAQTVTHQWSYSCSIHDHDEAKRTVFIYTAVNLRGTCVTYCIKYYWNILIDTKHRAASLPQQGNLIVTMG